MKRAEFVEAARTLASDHCLSIVDCLRRRGWSIASEVAQELGIHISTATKDLSSLYDCGVVERRKSDRKTRPAYEYRLRDERISLELDLDEPNGDSPAELQVYYLCFIERIFQKARRIGWHSVQEDISAELGGGKSFVDDVVLQELARAKQSSGVSGQKSVFLRFLSGIRKVFVANLGEMITARVFESASKDTRRDFPLVHETQNPLAGLGVRRNG